MPEIEYKIVYTGDNARIIRANEALIASFVRLDAQIIKTMARLNNMASTTAGFSILNNRIKQSENALGSLASKAGTAQTAVAKVGVGASLARFNTQASQATTNLNQMAAAAGAAGPAIAGVGAGGAGAGGGGRESVGRSALGTAIGGALFTAGRAAIGAVGAAGREEREFLGSAAEKAAQYRKSLQDLGILKGGGADAALIEQDLAFQKTTNLAPEQAARFRLEFGGAIQPSMTARGADGTPNITPEVARELEGEAGKLTARYNLDAVTGGRMAGLLGVTSKVPTAKAGVEELTGIMELLNVEGVGPISGMATSLLQLSGQMVDSEGEGRFENYQQLAARLASSTVFSGGRPMIAKTRIEQANRLLNKYQETDKGAGKFAGHGNAEFLQGAGVGPDDDYEAAIRKVGTALTGADGKFDEAQANQILSSYGFGNSAERKAIIEQIKVTPLAEAGLANPDLQRKIAAAGSGQAYAAYRASDLGQNQAAENAEMAANVRLGLGSERLERGRAQARARMTEPNQPGGQRLKAEGSTVLTDMFRSVMSLNTISAEDQRVNIEAVQGLVQGGSQVGVDVAKMFPDLYRTTQGKMQEPQAFAADYNRAFQAIESAGGDPMGGAPKKAADALRNAANALDNLGAGQGGPPMRPPGDGGAGVVAGRR